MMVRVLKGRNIVLGVTGGIAAYKSADLASKLSQAGAIVDVIMTEAATHFISPLTFQTLTHRPVVIEMFALLKEMEIAHTSLAERADLLIVAPATANTIAKMAQGIADNMLTATFLSTTAPVIVAPAMEERMYENPATQANLSTLRERGVVIVGPAYGRLASGRIGKGRLAEVSEIIGTIRMVLGREGELAGKRVLVTAGGTREPIDPVRFIGNPSSGKMGYALAEEARDRGAEVTLISAPTTLAKPVGVKFVAVETAKEMFDGVMSAIPESDILLMAAAVADYRVENRARRKIKKEEREEITLRLVRNPDILSEVARRRDEMAKPLVVVGFAAETEDLVEKARAKLLKKKLDLIVANDITSPDSGFGVDTNRVTIIDREGNIEALPLLKKTEVAEIVLDKATELLGSSRL
jgi:phosphopantothenoylcysteine decarboxylase/phosphopantothenate--cysteine ligase